MYSRSRDKVGEAILAICQKAWEINEIKEFGPELRFFVLFCFVKLLIEICLVVQQVADLQMQEASCYWLFNVNSSSDLGFIFSNLW